MERGKKNGGAPDSHQKARYIKPQMTLLSLQCTEGKPIYSMTEVMYGMVTSMVFGPS